MQYSFFQRSNLLGASGNNPDNEDLEEGEFADDVDVLEETKVHWNNELVVNCAPHKASKQWCLKAHVKKVHDNIKDVCCAFDKEDLMIASTRLHFKIEIVIVINVALQESGLPRLSYL